MNMFDQVRDMFTFRGMFLTPAAGQNRCKSLFLIYVTRDEHIKTIPYFTVAPRGRYL